MQINVVHDLRPLFGTAREQHGRSTCLAIAASDCHAALRGSWQPLSVEYLFYHAQKRANFPRGRGSKFEHILEALKDDGQPIEADWPYNLSEPDPKTWQPPAGITSVFKRHGQEQTHLFDTIVDELAHGRPVIIGMLLSDSIYAPNLDGVLEAPPSEIPDPNLRHAVLAVGYGTRAKEQLVLVRNSWGTGWGLLGYAWLPKSYLEPRLQRLAVLSEDPNVPAS